MFRLKIFILLCIYSFSIFAQSKEKCLFGDCKDGRGIFIDIHGNEFGGVFVNGKLEGVGEIKFKNDENFPAFIKIPHTVENLNSLIQMEKLYMEPSLRVDLVVTTDVKLGLNLYSIRM